MTQSIGTIVNDWEDADGTFRSVGLSNNFREHGLTPVAIKFKDGQGQEQKAYLPTKVFKSIAHKPASILGQEVQFSWEKDPVAETFVVKTIESLDDPGADSANERHEDTFGERVLPTGMSLDEL